MDKIDETRWEQARQPNRKELNATAVLKIPLTEAVSKIRQGPPVEKTADENLDVWSGVIPYLHTFGEPEAV